MSIESITPIVESRVIEPVPVAGEVLSFTSVPLADAPAWSPSSPYLIGDEAQVEADLMVYRAKTDNTGKAPGLSPDDWKPIRPINRFAMFDMSLGTVTKAAESITVRLRPGVPVSGLFASRVTAGRALVQVRNLTTGETLLEHEAVVTDAFIDDWFEHFFGTVDSTGDVLLLDMPQSADAEITVVFDGLPEVSVAALVVGPVYRLGSPQYGLGARRITYSKFNTDEDNVTTVERRPTVRRSDVQMFFDARRLNKMLALLERLDGVTCVWLPVPLPGYESLAVLGWHRDVTVSLPHEGMHRCNMYFQGAP